MKENSLFTLRRSERIGILVLLIMLFVLITTRYFMIENYLAATESYSSSMDSITFHTIKRDTFQKKKYTKKFNNNRSKKYTTKKKNTYKKKQSIEKINPVYFNFDPNTLPQDSLIILGINKKSASNIVKYRSKGGSFKDSTDLSKIYGLKKETYEKLKEYINITTKVEEKQIKKIEKDRSTSSKKIAYKTPLDITVEINSADTSTLKMVPGIGSFYAKQIVETREKLGGYTKLDQLLDIYTLDEERLSKLTQYLIIDSTKVHKIKINESDVSIIGKHPYISWKKAKILVNYRKQHGKYTKKEDLKKIVVFDEKFLDKISPYIEY